MVLNEKLTTVSRSHLAFDTTRHEDFRQHTIFSVEKNRSGQAGVDLEFQKDFRLLSVQAKWPVRE